MLIFWALTGQTPVEAGLSTFTEYTPDEHGGGTITSDIAEDQYGNLYFANESGLLKFDGKNWRLMPATGGSSYLSSVAVDAANKIWVTTANTIGFYAESPPGQYAYTNLSDSLPELKTDLGTFWRLYSHKQSIFLITTAYVLRWDGSSWESWHFKSEQRILPSWVDQALYIHARGTGLFALKDNTFELVARETDAIASGIISITRSAEAGLICSTVSNGLFYFENETFRTYTAALENTQILDARFIQNGYFTVGTANQGILFLDQEGRRVSHAEHDGVSIYKLYESGTGTLWAATTGAILEIHTPSLTHSPNEAFDIARHKEDLYFTNGRELRYLPLGNAQTSAETILQATALWDIHSTEGDLIYGGSKVFGGYQKGVGKFSITHPRHVGYIYRSWKSPNLLYSNDPPTVSRWVRKPSGWAYLDSLSGFQSRALSLVELPDSQLLISGENSPLLLADWDHPNEIVRLGEPEGLPDKFVWAHCLRHDDTVIAITNRGLYRYAPETERFDFDPILGKNLGMDAYALESCPAANGSGWILHLPTATPSEYRIGHLSIKKDGSLEWAALDLPAVDLAGKVEALFHEHIDQDEILWVGGSKQLLRYNLSMLPDYNPPHTRLTRIGEKTTNTFYFNGAGAAPDQLTWDYPQRNLQLEYAAPPHPLKVEAYETRLSGFESAWSEPTQATFREFTNLPHGKYTFAARAIDEFGRRGDSALLSFTILPPWYLTAYAYLGYALGGVGFLIAVVHLYSRRLRQQRARLQALVTARTAELEERQKQLTRANQAKQNFLASMSHEIRNPLNGIIGVVRILKKKEQAAGLSSKEISYLDACSRHLNQLLGQTLDYSSLESGKIRTQIASFNPNTLLEEVTQMHQEIAEKKGLDLILDRPKVPHNWCGDPVLLKQILINLVSNAIKYTPEGAVTVTLHYEELEDSVDARFEVTDTGPGIPAAMQALIFEEFERLPESIQQQIPGTGLGLTISAKMARIIGGELTLDKDHTPGARFVLRAEFGIDLYLPSQHRDAEDCPPALLPGRHALVADDMDFNRYISAEVLQSMGAEIDQAEDGRIALAKLQTKHYDIAVLDLSMPELSGIEVVETFLRQHPQHKPQLIALSAYNTAEIEAKCLAAGFDHFIEKPLDPEKLATALQDKAKPASGQMGSNNDLLDYLAANSAKSMDQLQNEYQRACLEELHKLEHALKRGDPSLSRNFIHNLIGLISIQKDPKLTEWVSELSAGVKAGAPKEQTGHIIREMREQLAVKHMDQR